MATGVGRGTICLTSFSISQTPNSPCKAQESRRFLLHKPSYSMFCLKFPCHGIRGSVVVEFAWHRLVARENVITKTKISFVLQFHKLHDKA